MTQKNTLYAVVMVLFVSILTFGITTSAFAEPSVLDSLNSNQPNDLLDVEENGFLSGDENRSLTLIIGQLIVYTLFILLLIYGLIKFLSIRQNKFLPNQAVKMIGGTPLGNNKSLQLVKVGEKVYLIGVADQITLIKEFSSEEELKRIEDDLGNSKQMSLTNSLFSMKKANTGTGQEHHSGFQQLFSQSLNKQKEKQGQLEQDLLKEKQEKEGHTR